MYFDDRIDAARQLAGALRRYAGSHPLILAIPRGAVPMGKVLAGQLDGDLDVVLVRKLRSPMNPEFAIGAVDETGWTYIPDEVRDLGVSESYLRRETAEQLELLRHRRIQYSGGDGTDPSGRVTIVVDDGLATGATMIAALHAVRARHPLKLICAVPVAASESLARVRPLADETVCLFAPPDFLAVSRFYRTFGQVSDDEVAELLKTHAARAKTPANAGETR